MCPNLVDIVIDIRYAILSRLEGHPNIQRIGMRGFPVQASTHFREVTLACFETILPLFLDRRRFPRVHTVRLLDYDHRRYTEHGLSMREAMRWTHWVECFKRDGTKFEDHDGKPIATDPAFRVARTFSDSILPIYINIMYVHKSPS